MADDELRLEVSADISKAQSDLNTFITTMGKMRGEGVALDDVIDQFDTSLTRVSKSLRDSSSSAKSNGTSVNRLTREYRELVSEVKSLEYAQKQAASNARNLQGGSASLQGLDPKQIEAMEAAQRRTTTAYQANNRAMREAAVVTDEVSTATKGATDSIITQRYALYDVASTYGIIGAALLGVSTLAVKTAADFESSFTSVERTFDSSTTVNQMAGIREELVNLSTQIPKTFDELAEVATLGNQLGIASEDIEDFTRVVTQFSAITGVSAEQAALAFGQIANLANVDPSEFEALGSAMALVGVNSAATETQIIAVTKEIAKASSDAGFTTDQIVGLSGAIASLGIAPERARGSLDTYFGTLNRAVANGGEELELFAQIVGVTASELDAMVRAGQGEDVFAGFLRGLADLDNVDTTRALDALNLSQLRVANSLGRLANAQDLYNSTQADAAQGWTEEAELQRQFGLIVDDVASQVTILINSLNALIAQLTGGMVPGIAGAIGVLSDMVNWLREVSNNEATQYIAAFALTLTVLVGVLAAFRAMSALATASSYALMTAQAALAGSGGIKGVIGLLGALIPGIASYTTTAEGATVVTYSLAGAMRALAVATGILAVVGIAVSFLTDFNGSMATTIDILATVAPFFIGVSRAIGSFLQTVSNAIGPVLSLALGIQGLGDMMLRSANLQEKGISAAQGWAKELRASSAATDYAGNAVKQVGSYTPDIQKLGGAFNDMGKQAGGAGAAVTKTVVTLKDYASDLAKVMSRAFEIRFSSQAAMDNITQKWIDLNDEMRDYQQKVAELTADRRVKEYFLSIAEAYNDTLRAGVLRAELMKIDDDLADATAGASKELKGNSKAAIENRKTVTDMVRGYQDYIEALAASGADQKTLNQAVARSRSEFVAQATALGYSNAELQPYIASFRDMKVAVDKVPRNITVDANTDPAQQAINEFLAANTGGRGASGGIRVPVSADTRSVQDALAKTARGANLLKMYNDAVARGADNFAIRYLNRLNSGNYKEGGYTGNGGTSAPAGIVHGKEFVFTAEATKNAGVGNLYGMMRSFEQGRGYQTGGYVAPRPVAAAPNSGVGTVQLAAYDRKLLIDIRDNIGVKIQPGALQSAVNGMNMNSSNRGAA